MKKLILSLSLLCLLGATPVAAKTLTRIAAVVNDEAITTYQLDTETEKALSQREDGHQLSAAQLDQLKSSLLERLINDKLLEQRIAELELTVGDSELEAAILDVREKNGLTAEELQQVLSSRGMSMAAYRAQIRNEILRYKLLGREVNYKVLVTSGEVRRYFDEHRDEFAVEPKISVKRISYPLPPAATEEQIRAIRSQAEATRQRLLSGEPFERVLEEQQDRVTGGDMGALVETDLAEPFQQALQGLQSGEVSEPVAMNNQLHLFLVTARDSADDSLFERVKDEIAERLRREKTDLRFQEWEKELRANAYVDVRL